MPPSRLTPPAGPIPARLTLRWILLSVWILVSFGLQALRPGPARAAVPSHGSTSPADRMAYLPAGSGPVAGATGLAFAGATPVALPDGGTQTASSWTAECWVRVAAGNALHTLVAVSRNVGGANAAGSYALGVAYNGYPYAVFNTASQSIQLTGFNALNDGAWHHLAGQVTTSGSSSTYQVYLDGAVQTGYPNVNNAGFGPIPATNAYVGSQWVPDAGGQAGSVSSIGGTAGRAGEGGFIGSISEVSISGAAQYSGNFTPPAAPFAAARAGQTALYHLAGNPFDSNTTGVPAATSVQAATDPVLTAGRATPVAYLFNGVYTGSLTPSLSGSPGAFSLASVSASGQTFVTDTATLSSAGGQNADGVGAASLSASGAGLSATPLTVPAVPATSPPSSSRFTAPWAVASVNPLFLGGKTYNSRYDARLPYPLWGDGGADCLTALLADEAFVSAHGGGLLYLPVGSYPAASTAGSAFTGCNNVFLLGDTALASPLYVADSAGTLGYHAGMVRTVLGYSTAANKGISVDSVTDWGLVDLTLRNTAPQAAQKNNPALELYNSPSGFGMDGVEWVTGDDGGLFGHASASHVAIENSRLDSTADVSGVGLYGSTFCVSHTSDLTLRNDLIRYPRGRIFLGSVQGGYVGGNSFVRTRPLGHNNVESGGPDISYCQGVSQASPLVIENNLITVDGVVDQDNFGEPLNAQSDEGAGTAANFRDVGTLTGVSGATLTDSSKSWYLTPPVAGVSNINGWQNADAPLVVCMNGGAALGQYRTVVGHTATTVTVDSPFSPPPAPGDPYSVSSWVLLHVAVRGNVFFNNFHITLGGIGAYQGCDYLSYTGNTLVNSGGIVLNAWDDPSGLHAPVWNSVVTGNTISNPDGLMLGFVGVQFVQTSPTLHGNLAYGNRVYGNAITPTPATSTASDSPLAHGPIRAEGVFQSIAPGSPVGDQSVAAQQGVLAAVNGDAPFPGVTYTTVTSTGGLAIPASVQGAAAGTKRRLQ